jgi:hypothetical protein
MSFQPQKKFLEVNGQLIPYEDGLLIPMNQIPNGQYFGLVQSTWQQRTATPRNCPDGVEPHHFYLVKEVGLAHRRTGDFYNAHSKEYLPVTSKLVYHSTLIMVKDTFMSA